MAEISHSMNDCERVKDTYENRMQLVLVSTQMLPEKCKKQILQQKNQQLRKEGIDTLTGLRVGMTQGEFDEMNRQFRINKALAQSDGGYV